MQISRITPTEISKYAKIPISFEVRSILEIHPIENGLGGFKFNEVSVEPYIKNYDDVGAHKPYNWSKHFDFSKWEIFIATDNNSPIAGATLIPEESLIDKSNKMGCATLWDIRVHPNYRGSGIGTKVFETALKTAKEKQWNLLKAETQNTNVPACEFYAKQGFKLGKIDLYKYKSNPVVKDEIMLVWYLDLSKPKNNSKQLPSTSQIIEKIVEKYQ